MSQLQIQRPQIQLLDLFAQIGFNPCTQTFNQNPNINSGPLFGGPVKYFSAGLLRHQLRVHKIFQTLDFYGS